MMFETLEPRPTDALLGLMAAFKSDLRSTKIDVGVGVYRDEYGLTPVMKAVKEAETQLLQTQQSKTYVGLMGDAQFNLSMIDLVVGQQARALGGRIRAVQTTGGCAALRALADLIASSKPNAKVWLSNPTWINHLPLIGAARLSLAQYPYYDPATQSVDFAAMIDCLKQLGPADVVLLHGGCHNPTGADLSTEQWSLIADLAVDRGFLPFVDFAYQGLGKGIDADAEGVRILAAKVPEMLLAVSCSKSFGIYRERVGCAMVIGANSSATQNMLDQVLTLIRGNYSMPPDHGAAAVQMVLNNPNLKVIWQDELNGMRARIQGLREGLAIEFRKQTNTNIYDYIAKQFGMFSLLGLAVAQVLALREQFGIYMPNDSRTNIAGLNANQIDTFVSAILQVKRTV